MEKLQKDIRIIPFVKEIFLIEKGTEGKIDKLPFYADGILELYILKPPME